MANYRDSIFGGPLTPQLRPPVYGAYGAFGGSADSAGASQGRLNNDNDTPSAQAPGEHRVLFKKRYRSHYLPETRRVVEPYVTREEYRPVSNRPVFTRPRVQPPAVPGDDEWPAMTTAAPRPQRELFTVAQLEELQRRLGLSASSGVGGGLRARTGERRARAQEEGLSTKVGEALRAQGENGTTSTDDTLYVPGAAAAARRRRFDEFMRAPRHVAEEGGLRGGRQYEGRSDRTTEDEKERVTSAIQGAEDDHEYGYVDTPGIPEEPKYKDWHDVQDEDARPGKDPELQSLQVELESVKKLVNFLLHSQQKEENEEESKKDGQQPKSALNAATFFEEEEEEGKKKEKDKAQVNTRNNEARWRLGTPSGEGLQATRFGPGEGSGQDKSGEGSGVAESWAKPAGGRVPEQHESEKPSAAAPEEAATKNADIGNGGPEIGLPERDDNNSEDGDTRPQARAMQAGSTAAARSSLKRLNSSRSTKRGGGGGGGALPLSPSLTLHCSSHNTHAVDKKYTNAARLGRRRVAFERPVRPSRATGSQVAAAAAPRQVLDAHSEQEGQAQAKSGGQDADTVDPVTRAENVSHRSSASSTLESHQPQQQQVQQGQAHFDQTGQGAEIEMEDEPTTTTTTATTTTTVGFWRRRWWVSCVLWTLVYGVGGYLSVSLYMFLREYTEIKDTPL